jgi:hypothetical protein
VYGVRLGSYLQGMPSTTDFLPSKSADDIRVADSRGRLARFDIATLTNSVGLAVYRFPYHPLTTCSDSARSPTQFFRAFSFRHT